MPRPAKPKTYDHSYRTEGMQVSKDGSVVRMENGHVYKRTVLPAFSQSQQSLEDQKILDQLDEE